MGLLLRTLLVWMLVLAVPVQGAAAATMALCGPNHHGTVAAAQTTPPHHAEAHTQGAADAHGSHDHHVAAAADDSTQPAPADVHTCNVCASCCSVGALLQSHLTLPELEFAATVFAAVVTTVDPYAAGGPDRPPRTSLA